MRYSAVVASLIAVAAARNRWTGFDTKWATHPDKTADWYISHDEALPEVAETITTVEDGKSYVVKLECLGCPFRQRKLYDVVETWQEPAQDNSLLLNFSLTADSQALLLYGQRIAPLAPMPIAIQAFQTPANLSKETMGKMVETHMLDDSFTLGTKYGKFELQYEHSVVGTEEHGRYYVQFDITHVHMRSIHSPASYALNKDGQKIAQVLLQDDAATGTMKIAEVQVVDRKDRAKPFLMKCGRLAIMTTAFNPLEWDYYGKLGSMSRSWNLLIHKSAEFLMGPGLLLIILTGIVGAVMLVKRWRIAKKQQQEDMDFNADEDVEAALLGGDEFEDAPPEYADVPKLEAEDDEKA